MDAGSWGKFNLQKLLKNEVVLATRIFNVDKLKESKNIPKTTWDLVNSEIGNSKTTQKGFEMDVNDNLTSSSITIADHNNFNDNLITFS